MFVLHYIKAQCARFRAQLFILPLYIGEHVYRVYGSNKYYKSITKRLGILILAQMEAEKPLCPTRYQSITLQNFSFIGLVTLQAMTDLKREHN